MTPKSTSPMKVAVVAALALTMTGCGEFVRQGRSPSQLIIQSLLAASGATPDDRAGHLMSDVETIVERSVGGAQVQVPTIYNDVGQVTMILTLKDPGQPGLFASPTALNMITISRYRVTYRRSDGRNTAGVDVPFPFDGATTFTVPAEGSITQSFELVRHIAKTEAPLLALARNFNIINTIAEITFYGRDQAGNDVSATGSIGVDFGNFGDPE